MSDNDIIDQFIDLARLAIADDDTTPLPFIVHDRAEADRLAAIGDHPEGILYMPPPAMALDALQEEEEITVADLRVGDHVLRWEPEISTHRPDGGYNVTGVWYRSDRNQYRFKGDGGQEHSWRPTFPLVVRSPRPESSDR